jgi:hypothetical protein
MHWMAPAPDAAGATAAAPAPTPATEKGRTFFDPDLTAAQSAPAAPTAPPVRWRELQDKLARATSLRAFYYEAIKRPQDGGYYYGRRALEMCERAEKVDADGSAAHRQAIEQLRQRCDFSEQERKDAEREFAAIRHADLSDDGVYRRMFGFLMAKTQEERVAAMQASIDLGNPIVMASLASPSIDVAIRESGAKAAPEFPNAAVLLTACRLGADCGPGSMMLLELCANMGWCGASVPDAMRDGLGADYALLDRLSQQAATDIRKGVLTRVTRTPWAKN